MTKPEVSRWIVAERKRQGWKSEELARRLSDAGYPVAETTVRTWEAGRRPSAEIIAALERLFDSRAPAEPQPVEDLSALVSAIGELVAEVRAERQARVEWERGLLEALRELAGAREQSDGPVGAPPEGAHR